MGDTGSTLVPELDPEAIEIDVRQRGVEFAACSRKYGHLCRADGRLISRWVLEGERGAARHELVPSMSFALQRGFICDSLGRSIYPQNWVANASAIGRWTSEYP